MEEEAIATVAGSGTESGMGVSASGSSASSAGDAGLAQGVSLGSTLATAALANYYNKKADKRVFKQQEKMQGLQIAGNKEMTDYNQKKALQMWRDTNYAAQMREMQNAGLSPGLMYGKGGAGGTTAQVTPGNVTQGKAERWTMPTEGIGMAVGNALQAELTKKQTELVSAETEKTKTETAKMGGVDTEEAKQRITESGTRTTKTAQETRNAEIQAKILDLQKQLNESTQGAQINRASLENRQIDQNIQKTEAETRTAQYEADNIPLRIRLQNTEQSLKNELIQQQIVSQVGMTNETFQKIEKISEEIVRMQEQTKQGQQGLDQEKIRIIMERMKTEFGADGAARLRTWIETIARGVNAIK